MFKVTLTFDSYEEALRVKQSAIDILNEYMFGEDPCEHFNHGTPKNALEIFVDALHKQVPIKGTMKDVIELKDYCVGTEAIPIDGKDYCVHYFEGCHMPDPIAVTMQELDDFVAHEQELVEKTMESHDEFTLALGGGGDA